MLEKLKKKQKNSLKSQKKTVSPTDTGSVLGITVLARKKHNITLKTENNNHLNTNTRLSDSRGH